MDPVSGGRSERSIYPDAPPPPYRHARTIFLTICAVAVAAVVVVGRAVLLPFLLALLVAYVLFPAVRLVERARIPRWAAILLVYITVIGTMAGFTTAVVPRLIEETKQLSAELPKLTQTVRDQWLPAIDARLRQIMGNPPPPPSVEPDETPPAPIVVRPREDGSFELTVEQEVQLVPREDGSWSLIPPGKQAPKQGFSSEQVLRDALDAAVAYAQRNSLELISYGRAIVTGISRGVFYFFLTLMLAGYLMFTYEGIHAFVREMWPSYRRAAFDRFLHRLDRGLAGVVRGQLLICLVNGVLSAIGFWFFELKYWPILSLIAGVMSIIPIFGSILSTIPAVAIGLTQGPGTALGVLIWIVGIHQLEANFLNPKIIGDQAKIHPVLVVFALLLGEHFFEITGALLAVPCLALVQTVFLHFRESVLGIPARSSLTPPPPPASEEAETVPAPERPSPLPRPAPRADTTTTLKSPD